MTLLSPSDEPVSDIEDPLEDRVLDSLRRLLDELQGRTGDVIRLRYVEGLQLNEIAERLEIPLGTVKYEHARALDQVRASLPVRRAGPRRRTLASLFAAPRLEPARPETRLESRWWTAWPVAAGLVAIGAVLALALGDLWRRAGTSPGAGGPVAGAGAEAGRSAADGAAEDRSASLGTVAAAERAPAIAREEEGLPPVAPAPLRTVRVRVTDGESALESGRVLLLGAEFAQLAEAPIGEDGWAQAALYSLDGLRKPLRPGGAPAVGIGVRDAGRAVPHIYFVEIESGDPEPFEIALAQPEVVLRGAVVGEDGLPIEGAMISVGHPSATPESLGPGLERLVRVGGAYTDAAGLFAMDRLTPGAHVVEVRARGYDSVRFDRVIDRPGTVELGDPIVLARARILSGVVRDSSGEAVSGAKVWLEQMDNRPGRVLATTDEHGQYALESVPEGPHVVWALVRREDRFLTGCGTIETDSGGPLALDIEVADRYLATLRLVDAQGAPLKGWRVFVVHEERYFRESSLTDENGVVHLPRDPGEPVDLLFLDLGPGHVAGAMPRAARHLPEPVEGVLEIELAPPVGATLVGRVRGDDGGEAPIAQFILFAPELTFSLRVPCAADGTFRCEGLIPGRYQGFARLPGSDRMYGMFDVGVGEEAAIHGRTLDLEDLRLDPSD